MKKRVIRVFVLLILFLPSHLPDGSAHEKTLNEPKDPADPLTAGIPYLEGLYALDFPITTKSDLARKYFNQGMILTYGFDHIDAERSFLEAARHDPECAMCYWGIAFVLGPNINAAMDEEAASRAYTYAQMALDLADGTTEREQMLIKALEVRYAPHPVKDRSEMDKAFADAMREAAKKYPDDADVGVLFAEALMDLHPWNYWTNDGAPQPWTPEIEAKLESILESHPRHPHALHLYIHLLENSPYPEKTVKSADVIIDLVPLSGHLVHMAGHGYFAAGLYHDCSEANEKAVEVDRILVSSFSPQGLYHMFYVPHVRHFLWASYSMEGRSADALKTARELAESVEEDMMNNPDKGTLQHFWTIPYYAMARFGKWEDILAETKPDEDRLYPRGVWHYMRGLAYTRKGLFEEAENELDALRTISGDPALEKVTIWDINNAKSLLAIATEVLAGELAAERKQYDKAVGHLEQAVALEEGLSFDEPPPWYYPVRQSLGAVLLDMGEAERAEEVYRKDLRKNPENGWSLFGLSESLRAQGKDVLAQDTEQRLMRAWARSDVRLTSSRF